MSAAARQRRGDFRTTTQQGYGWRHQKLRKQWAPIVATGRVECARGSACLRAHIPGGLLIRPGEPWDLGHDDADRSRYTGPEHRRCNRGAHSRHQRKVRFMSEAW